jgi:hypothetical protein
MADEKKLPALARVTRTSYLNDVLIEVAQGEEGPLVKWPEGVDPATAGDNLIPFNEDGTPFGGKGKKDPAA